MKWIDEIIVGLIDMYNTSCPLELCDCLDIKVIKVEPNNLILSGNSSVYVRDYLGNETIFVNNSLPLKTELFYLRHELGHAILHPSIKTSFNRNLINKYKLEKQANYFALKLSNIVLDRIEFNEMTIGQIACYLEIPENAIKQIISI